MKAGLPSNKVYTVLESMVKRNELVKAKSELVGKHENMIRNVNPFLADAIRRSNPIIQKIGEQIESSLTEIGKYAEDIPKQYLRIVDLANQFNKYNQATRRMV